MNVPSLIKLIIVAGDGIMLNGGGFTKHIDNDINMILLNSTATLTLSSDN